MDNNHIVTISTVFNIVTTELLLSSHCVTILLQYHCYNIIILTTKLIVNSLPLVLPKWKLKYAII